MDDIYNSKIAAFIGWLNGAKHGYAVTISSTCTLYSVPEKQIGTRWQIHENTHKEQWATVSWFLFKYLYQNIRYGYQKNIYEQAARMAEHE